eukprot:TRINITY_DN4103_c0_g1_i2.p1 TRINITY_DN4103_c0_g1~~TRINITY_DN4103_c0_g1_i2.p1  ORF type:complete len:258 (+),score=45.52 TRINITY_DN4103_c0_g1_i2:341-1114(+)
MAFVNVVRAIDPRGLRDIYGERDVLSLSPLVSTAFLMCTSETAVLLLSLKKMPGAADTTSRFAPLVVRVWRAIPLAPEDVFLRCVMHASSLILFILSQIAPRIWLQRLAILCWFVALILTTSFDLLLLGQLRRQLTRTGEVQQNQVRARTISKLSKLFAVISFFLLLWVPLFSLQLSSQLSNTHVRHLTLRSPVTLFQLLEISLVDIVYLSIVLIVAVFFLADRDSASPATTPRRFLSPAPLQHCCEPTQTGAISVV